MENGERSNKCSISKFEHEHTVWQMARANLRMFIVILVVCATISTIVVTFVNAHTEREKKWIDAFTNLNAQITEMYNTINERQKGP